jgi:hypothetical protein
VFRKGGVARIARGPVALYARFVILYSGEKTRAVTKLLDAHQHDSASVLCYCLGPKRVHPKKVRRRHEQIAPPSPNQASRPIECYRGVVSALGFQLRPELLSLDRPLNQRPPDVADSQLERTAFVPPAWRASLYPHRFAVYHPSRAGIDRNDRHRDRAKVSPAN